MKNNVNRFLLVWALLSIPLYALAWLLWDPFTLLVFPAVPLFCLQLLLCRTAQRRWVWGLPLCGVALFALAGAGIMLVFPGWDGLLGLIMLFGSIAPAAGCVLGLLAWGIPRWLDRRKENG